MSYRLDLSAPVPSELRRIADEQLAGAAVRLREQHDVDPADAIHATRKDIKKTRSLLRLARTGMRKKAYRAENRALRDLARSISAQRDADVMAATVDKLAERFAGQLPASAFDTLRERFAEESAQQRASSGNPDAAKIADQLATAGARVSRWPLDAELGALATGATVAYKRGRSAFETAHKNPSPERLHNWRKRAKDLWYHARLLRNAWPAQLKATAKEAHRLSDVLGDDHDLAVLAERIGGLEAVATPEDEILALIETRRAELQTEAMRLGARLYAERPKAFGRRLRRYLADAEQAPLAAA